MKLLYKEVVNGIELEFSFEHDPVVFYRKDTIGSSTVIMAIKFCELPEVAKQAYYNTH